MSKGLVYKKEKIKCNSIIKQYKVFDFDYIIKEDIRNINQIGHKFLIILTEYYQLEVRDLEKQRNWLI